MVAKTTLGKMFSKRSSKGWTSVLIILQFLLPFVVADTKGQDDDTKRYFLNDKACRQDSVLVECYQKCRDPKEVYTLYSSLNVNNIWKSIAERKKSTPDDIFGCPISCYTDPELEICQHTCKPPLDDLFKQCIGIDTCKAWTIPPTKECTDCFKGIVERSRNLCANDLTECHENIDACVKHPSTTTIGLFGTCFSTKMMEGDIESCKTACTTSKAKKGACEKVCEKHLTNNYCQDSCVTNQLESPFKKCLEVCDKTTHPLCSESCSTLESCLKSCQTDKGILSCFSKCRARINEQIQHTTNSVKQTYFLKAVDECLKDSVNDLKNYISVEEGRPKVFPGQDDSNYSWLINNLTPEECIEACAAASDKQICFTDECSKTLLDDVRKKELCNKDPFRIKGLVHLAAAGEKSLEFTAFQAAFTTEFNEYVIDYTNTGIITKFLITFVNAPIKHCKDLCQSLKPEEQESAELQNAGCYYRCFETHKKVCLHTPAATVRLTDFPNCRWKLDYSSTKDPTTVTASYFNEKQSFDVKENLEKPNSTQYLDQTDTGGSTGFFAFPFFLIVRADCDGGYYATDFYRLFMDGSYPTVNLQYFPSTAREEYHNSVLGSFTSVLVNLKYDPNDVLVPENPQEKAAGGPDGCHWKICYPGFVVPLIFYRIPIFEVTVDAQDVFKKLTTTVYVSIYNKRGEKGSGELKMTSSESLTVPSMFFPKDRITGDRDTDLAILTSSGCLDPIKGYCPDIDDTTNSLYEEYTEDNPSPNYPLDVEDLFSPQYTFLNTPAIAIGGFYNPNLVLIGDPDFDKFYLVDWVSEEKNNLIFDNKYQCLRSSSVRADGFPKPMYSQIDRTDPTFPIKFYRVRYDAREYGNPEKGARGIFSIISLQDRLLITTTSGLVVFYGNTNDTVRTSKQFKAPEEEKLRKCFKFVRIAKRAQPENDLVVGITYTYNEQGDDGEKIEINQEIWVGKFSKPGERIEWRQITKKGGLSDNPSEYFFPNEAGAGDIVTLNPGKIVGVPIKVRSDNAKSEIEALCFRAYKSRMASSSEIQLKDEQGWCEAIDVTPVITKRNTIQVLVRMRVKYVGTQTATSSKADVVLYILATHVLRQSVEQLVKWTIDSIIPRIPCSDQHKESVRNILLFDLSYFSHVGPNARGCQNINADLTFNHIYLTSLTYTRTLSNHVFVYGTRLLQSADGGQTFVNLQSFPHESEKNSPLYDRSRNRHRIVIMAFGGEGHYSFLTSKRELWIGNTGTLVQLRVRPSSGYSMTQTIVSRVKGIQDGIPFSLLYDRYDSLIEVVGVLDDGGNVERILKRPVPISNILRNQRMNNELRQKGKELEETNKPSELFTYEASKWNLYCPFSSPSFSENYSETFSRNQMFIFSPPRQHPDLGKDYTLSSLMAFQVSTFSLVWESFFNINYSSYSQFDTEPFQRWVDEKQSISKIGLLKFLRGNSETDGVLVSPDENRRIVTKSKSRILRFYYLDYGFILRMELTYSIKNDNSLGNTDYFTQQISQIQLNVDNANGSLLQIDTEKVQVASQASVKFVIHISVIKNAGLVQNLPGQHLIPVPIVFHLIGAFGNCVKRTSDPLVTDTLSTVVYVGCPSAIDILFNWNDTLTSIKFRDKNAHYGRLDDGGESECYNDEFVCFFARQPLVLYFDIFDMAKQAYIPFKGNYIMRVIGGGYTKEDLLKSHYSDDEQEAFNIPGVSDVSLIWNEWDIMKAQKIDRKPAAEQGETGKVTKDVILKAGESAVQWACHTLSPCARITPNLYMQTVYFFRISISNRDVDNSTLCLFEKNFDIMLYGFPPSPETQLLTTILFCLCMLGLLYLLFFCCRGHKRVWRATKVRMYGWYQIVKDTFPKPLKKHEAEGADEGQTQQQKDKIILSLQGHLKIPNLVGRNSVADDGQGFSRDDDSIASRPSSSTISMRSTFSTMSTQEVLNPVSARNPATTWTDLVYEQIISKRLTAIVEKNTKMRATIMRTTSTRLSSDFEQERRYEVEHKRTVSDESLNIPKKKDES